MSHYGPAFGGDSRYDDRYYFFEIHLLEYFMIFRSSDHPIAMTALAPAHMVPVGLDQVVEWELLEQIYGQFNGICHSCQFSKRISILSILMSGIALRTRRTGGAETTILL